MSNGTAVIVGVGVLAVVGLLMLRPKKAIVGAGGAGYLPGKSSTVAAGIAGISSVFSKGIDYFIGRGANEAAVETAKINAGAYAVENIEY
jgi:hypothetical protein